MQDWHIAHTWEPGSRPFVGLSHRVVHDNSDHATGVRLLKAYTRIGETVFKDPEIPFGPHKRRV